MSIEHGFLQYDKLIRNNLGETTVQCWVFLGYRNLPGINLFIILGQVPGSYVNAWFLLSFNLRLNIPIFSFIIPHRSSIRCGITLQVNAQHDINSVINRQALTLGWSTAVDGCWDRLTLVVLCPLMLSSSSLCCLLSSFLLTQPQSLIYYISSLG